MRQGVQTSKMGRGNKFNPIQLADLEIFALQSNLGNFDDSFLLIFDHGGPTIHSLVKSISNI